MAESTGINYMAGLAGFLKAWDSPTRASDTTRIDIRENDLGQKNLTGDEDAPARAFVRHHALFEASLEDGVKPLVLFLVNDLNCITYSSCAGHCGKDQIIIRHVRHVGIVPRDQEEMLRLRATFAQAIDRVNSMEEIVSVRMDETVLDSEALRVACLDINFLPKPGLEQRYFHVIDNVCERLIQELQVDKSLLSEP